MAEVLPLRRKGGGMADNHRLSRQNEEDGAFYEWGIYDLSSREDAKAAVYAAFELGQRGAVDIKLEKVQ